MYFKNFIYNLTDMFNNLLQDDQIDKSLTTGRLICFNKYGDEKIPTINDGIRPINVQSSIIKCLEKCILNRLVQENIYEKLAKEQVGFIPTLSTNTNLIRLREEISKYKESYTNNDKRISKYLLFIDLKAAYDNVDHLILFHKLNSIGISEEIINSIKLIYSSCCIKLDYYGSIININKGVMQGGILSPILFNIYINDLLIKLRKYSPALLAYADDLALIAINKNNLIDSINIIERWSEENKININKNKSGIMTIDGINNDNEIKGIKIVKEYKYLGVTIDNNINPINHVKKINNKLNIYLRRNFLLKKNIFSVKTLKQIYTYYQKSRLTYGMVAFVDRKAVMDNLKKNCGKFIRSILGIYNLHTNSSLLACIGETTPEYFLIQQLLKEKKKAEKHFNTKYFFWDTVLNKTFTWIKLYSNYYNDFDDFLNNTNKNIVKQVFTYSTLLTHNIKSHFDLYLVIQKYWWKFVSRNTFILKFLLGLGFYASKEDWKRNCTFCDAKEIERSHFLDECISLIDAKKEILKEIEKLGLKINGEKRLTDEVVNLFFQQNFRNSKSIKNIIKFFINFYGIMGMYFGKLKREEEKD